MAENKICGYPLLYFDTLPSTNTYIKEHLDELCDKTVVIADMQSSGRGRLGNTWLATRDMLPVSVLLKNPESALHITLICAIAVCRAAERLCGLPMQIKWTNDIICQNRKVCGILCESMIKCSAGGSAKPGYVICGMGLNVNQPASFFEQAGLENAASLFSLTDKKYEKMLAAEYIVSELFSLCELGFDKILSEYQTRCLTIGKQVKLVQNNTETIAFAKAISADGSLICENENGTFAVNAGQVRVRGVNGEYV